MEPGAARETEFKLMSGNLVSDLAGHVKDADNFHLPGGIHLHIPQFLLDIGITKFILIEFGAALLMAAVFIPMAVKLRKGQPLKGRFWNLLEVFLFYLRDQVIVPSIGKKDAKPFIPFLWTLFFFVLFCNLGGMVPWVGSPTGSLTVTFTLALCTFGVVVLTGMLKHGVTGYWLGLVPHMDLPAAVAVLLKPMLFVIELAGLLIKHVVLSVRLMANMYAGHLVLAVFLAFIPMTAAMFWIWVPVTVGSVAMSVCISFLELFVAFLQAYIFTFLSALYIGMSVHQH